MYKDGHAVYIANATETEPLCVAGSSPNGGFDYSYTIFLDNDGAVLGFLHHQYENGKIVKDKTIVEGVIPARYVQKELRHVI